MRRVSLEEKVDPASAAVLVVDMQNDFCDAAGAVMQLGGRDVGLIRDMIPRLGDFVGAARTAGVRVLFITGIYDEVYISDVQWLLADARGSLCHEGTWGAEVVPELKPRVGEVVVRKHRYSGFVDTDLDLLLRSRGVRSLIMTGVATSVCVDTTARDGFMRDYHVVYVEDCMSNAWPTDDMHRATLDIARRFFGMVVRSTEIMAIWRRGARAKSR